MSFVDEIQAILNRTSEHLKTFHEEVSAYVKTNPYELVFKPYSERERGEIDYVILVKVNRPIPERIPVLAGEVISGLRVSLDHMIYALSYNHTVLRKGILVNMDEARTEFPIFNDPVIFSERIKSGCNKGKPTPRSGLFKIRYTAPEVQAIVKILQPYNARNYGLTHQMHSLWVLHYLNNTNKHRRLNILGLPAGRVALYTSDNAFFESSGEFLARRPLKDGAIFGRGKIIAPSAEDFYVRMNREYTTQIPFHEGGVPDQYAGWLLQEIFTFVESDVLNTLVTFL